MQFISWDKAYRNHMTSNALLLKVSSNYFCAYVNLNANPLCSEYFSLTL